MSKSKPIADELRKLIAEAEQQGISRYRLAQLSGVSEGQLSRLVNGQVDPRLDSAERIARALGHRLRIVAD